MAQWEQRVRQEDGGHQGVKAPQEGVYLAPRGNQAQLVFQDPWVNRGWD